MVIQYIVMISFKQISLGSSVSVVDRNKRANLNNLLAICLIYGLCYLVGFVF